MKAIIETDGVVYGPFPSAEDGALWACRQLGAATWRLTKLRDPVMPIMTESPARAWESQVPLSTGDANHFAFPRA